MNKTKTAKPPTTANGAVSPASVLSSKVADSAITMPEAAEAVEHPEPSPELWTMPDSFKVADLKEIIEACGAPPIADTFNAQGVAREVSLIIYGLENPPLVRPEHKPALKRLERFKLAWSILERDLPFLVESRQQQAIKLRKGGLPHMTAAANDIERDIPRLETLIEVMSKTKYLCFIVERKKRGQHSSAALPYSHDLVQIFMRLGWAWEEAGSKPATASKRYKIIEAILRKHCPGGPMATAEAIRKAIGKRFKEQPELKTPEPYKLGTK